MEFIDYLKSYQPFVYHTFKNAVELDKISQAYLIKGSSGAPLFECAKFLAKSLICDQDVFACNTCLDCIRFDDGNYSDLKIIDGSTSPIKVSDIEELQSFLSTSSIEVKGIKIYIINELENANKESINALLKTLEEPNPNVFAFITTKNETKLLPTILSRCQILNLLPINKSFVKEEALSKGLELLDVEILSSLYTDIDTITNIVNDDTYIKCRDASLNLLDNLYISPKRALYYVDKEIITKIKTKEEARLFFDIFSILLKDVTRLQMKEDISISSKKDILEKISKKYSNIQSTYLETLLTRGKIDLNVSISLLIEHVLIHMIKGGK